MAEIPKYFHKSLPKECETKERGCSLVFVLLKTLLSFLCAIESNDIAYVTYTSRYIR